MSTLRARRITALTASVFAASLALTGCSSLQGLIGGETISRDSETEEITEAGTADVFQMKTGDCFNEPSASDMISDLPAVPCSEPHEYEIYYDFEMPAGDYPGDAAIDSAVETECLAAFDTFVGVSYANGESSLGIFPITPSQDGWEQIDDRQILCAVFDPTGTVTGSLQGAAR